MDVVCSPTVAHCASVRLGSAGDAKRQRLAWSVPPARCTQRAPLPARLVAQAATTALVPVRASTRKPSAKVARAQQKILDSVSSAVGRGRSGMDADQLSALDAAVAVLEADGGVPAPAASPLLDGRWRLLFTTRPGTASPIQRAFTGVEAFKVYQEISLAHGSPARVDNVVEFGTVGSLRVEAEASTDRRPIPGFVPRRGSGLPFGILGVSATTSPARPNLRVDFQFDNAAFYFNFLPFTLPYPVPFRLLGDERKGWIDVTYLSPDGQFRLARGNKGTTFVLVRDDPPRQQLLQAIVAGANDAEIERLAEDLAAAGGGERFPARAAAALGNWRLLWSRQGETANPLQRLLAGRVRNFQIITDDGELENRVELPLGARVRAIARCEPDGPSRTGVEISKVIFELGPLQAELPGVRQDSRGFVDWLYLDNEIRITRGSKGSLFVHIRDEEEQ
jgi:hypothetical protein